MTLLEFQASQLARAAADILAVSGPLHGVLCNLGQTNLAITQATTLAELVAQVATYDGYANQAVVWGTPVVNQAQIVEVVATALVFTPTGSVTPNSIYNAWITDSGATHLYYAGTLDAAPVGLSSPLNQLELTVRYRPAVPSIVVEVV